MKYLIQLATILTLIGCQTGHVVNNARPKVGNKGIVYDTTIPTDISTWTWLPWYIIVVIILIIVAIKTWKQR